MSNIVTLLDRLSTNLGTIKEKVRIENSANNLGINVLLESKFLEIYNITTGMNLANSNLLKKNFPGIDGVDFDGRVMAQVTSTFSNQKIENTIKKIIEQKLYLKFDRLIFLFLSDKQKLSPSFTTKINEYIDGKFDFDFERDIIDLNEIYRVNLTSQDIAKINDIVKLLDEVLKYLPEKGTTKFRAVSVCFHKEEDNNISYVIEALIREGNNVYLNSKSVYDKFKSQKYSLSDFVVYAGKGIRLDNIELCIVVLSNSFINQNMIKGLDKIQCNLYESAVNKNTKIETISFDRYLSDIKRISNSSLRSYQSVSKNNIENVIKAIIDTNKKQAIFSTIKPEDIIDELIDTNRIFKHTKVHDGDDYILISFVIEQLENMEMNYIVIKRDYVLKRLIDEYKAKHKNRYNKNLNILVPKDFLQKTRKRLDLIISEFPESKNRVFYIDEHLFDKKYKSLEQEPLLSTKDFITPFVKEGIDLNAGLKVSQDNKDLKNINDIIHWIFNDSESSVAIIYGLGGIGKTTLSEKIHDKIIKEHDRNIVIFIDANQYIKIFEGHESALDSEYDLYTIFNKCHSHAAKIDRNSFYLNYALGNIIIIFDGIDEVISTIPTFSLYKFIDNLENLREAYGKGKMLINCRDSYIRDLLLFYKKNHEETKQKNIKVYELLGFNDDLSKNFFSIHFSDPEKQKICHKLLQEFYPNQNDNEFKYPPFVLEIIVEIVTDDFNYSEIGVGFSSEFLMANEQNDIVVYRICNREKVKKEDFGFHLTVDKQVLFFCNFAVEEKGIIDCGNIDRIISDIGIKDRISNFAKGISDHPLLLKTESSYKFRFGFFETYFKSVYLSKVLTSDIKYNITDAFVNVIASECVYNSVLFKQLFARLEKSDKKIDDMLKSIKNIFEKVHEKEIDEKGKLNSKGMKLISNLFLLVHKLAIQLKCTDKDIIRELFEENSNNKNIISNFFLIDIPFSAELRLDFSGKIFKETTINCYQNFFKCDFSNETFFDDSCVFNDVYSEKINLKLVTAKKENFDSNIKGDNTISKILSLKENPDDILSFVKMYLKSFRDKNKLALFVSTRSIVTIHHDFITVELITEMLLKNGILKNRQNGNVYINTDFEKKIIKFLNQGIPFLELKNTVRELMGAITSRTLDLK